MPRLGRPSPAARLLPGLLAALLIAALPWAPGARAGVPADRQGPAQAAEGPPDLRILIDVSGSMRRNDPANLRAPALRLLAGLLPEGARAGVWLFARYVNMVVPWGPVDEAWKARAREASRGIHAHGLYTDLEAVLRRAAFAWGPPGRGGRPARRSVLLLTDGLVDVPGGADADRASRERILTRLLPRLQEQGIRVYGVALSREADRALLRQLAAATGGWYEEAEDAQALSRLFLRLFERAAAPEGLPLEGQALEVDPSVRELTLVVFRRPQALPPLLVDPAGRRHTLDAPGEGVRWHHEPGYDLVTVAGPRPGTWQVLTEPDPDNRVLVLTDLRLEADPIPANLALDRPFELHARLSQGGRPVTDPGFLGLLRLSLSARGPAGRWTWTLRDDGREGDVAGGDGLYTLRLPRWEAPGRLELALRAEGPTFRRERRQAVWIREAPAAVVLLPASQGGPALSVVPYQGLLNPATATAEVVFLSEDGGEEGSGGLAMALPRAGAAGWRLDLGPYLEAARRGLLVRLHGRDGQGRPVEARVGPLRLAGGGEALEGPAAQAPPWAERPPAARPAPRLASPPQPRPRSEAEPEPGAPQEGHGMPLWLEVTLQTLAANLLLGLLAWQGLRWWRRQTGLPEAVLGGPAEGPQGPEAPPPSGPPPRAEEATP